MKKTIVLFLCFLFVLISCGQSEKTTDDILTIAVVPKLVGIPYFNAAERGAIRAGEELGVNVIYVGPATADAAEQVRLIEDLLVQGIDVLAVAPNDPVAITPVLNKARTLGVIVLDWDTPADLDAVDYSVRQIDNETYGKVIAEELIKGMGESGDVGIITGGLSAANLNAWIDVAKKALEKYPNINLVSDPIPSDEQQQLAYQRALEMLQAYPNVKGILGYSSVAPIGIAQAIRERGLQNTITVVGTSLPTDSAPFLEDGSMTAAVLWDPARLSFLAVSIGKLLAEGKTIEDGMEIPNFGKISVDGKIIIMGAPTVFTKENAKDFDF